MIPNNTPNFKNIHKRTLFLTYPKNNALQFVNCMTPDVNCINRTKENSRLM